MRYNDQGSIVEDKGMSKYSKETTPSNIDLKGSSNVLRIRPAHHKLVASWWAARGKKVDTDTFSDCGFIVDGRVAGFLYVTNSNMAMIEGIIADPYTIPSFRRQSTRKLIGILIDTATMLGFANVFGISKHPSIEKISKEFGFKQEVFNIFTLNTEKDK